MPNRYTLCQLSFCVNLLKSISGSMCWETRNIIISKVMMYIILEYFWLRTVLKHKARNSETLRGNDRLDNVKFHVEIPKLLVINPQVMPDPQDYWKQWEMKGGNAITILFIEKLSHCYHGYDGLFIVQILRSKFVSNTSSSFKFTCCQPVTHEDS